MRLQPRSALALSKALATCNGDLVLLVLLHSYEELALDDLRCDASSVGGLAEGPDQFAPFYAFLKDPPGGLRRGLVPEQAYDMWHSFVHGMVVPLPNVAMVRPDIVPATLALAGLVGSVSCQWFLSRRSCTEAAHRLCGLETVANTCRRRSRRALCQSTIYMRNQSTVRS
jgi:hypothetical protein